MSAAISPGSVGDLFGLPDVVLAFHCSEGLLGKEDVGTAASPAVRRSEVRLARGAAVRAQEGLQGEHSGRERLPGDSLRCA
jgi:hypothetical protein